jgi:multidrug transporter EmrE-like cation transporter
MAAGIIFSLLAAVTLNSGNIVQKHALNALPEITVEQTSHLVRTLLSSRLWIGGFLLCLVGVGLQVLAFASAPIAVVQSIFSACIVLLIVLSRLRLGERLQRVEWAGLAVVVAAVIAISTTLTSSATSAGTAGATLSILVALTPTLLVVIVLVAGIHVAQSTGALRYGVAAGLLYGAAALGTKGASTFVERHGLLAGIPSIMTSMYPYIFIGFSGLGMLVYQMGIQRFRITIVGAMSDVVSSTYVVAVGTILFSESFPKEPVMFALRVGGFVGVLIGTLLVGLGGRGLTAADVPMSESDLGLGRVLVREVDSVVPKAVDGANVGPRRASAVVERNLE